jgi:hypothetical protein
MAFSAFPFNSYAARAIESNAIWALSAILRLISEPLSGAYKMAAIVPMAAPVMRPRNTFEFVFIVYDFNIVS